MQRGDCVTLGLSEDVGVVVEVRGEWIGVVWMMALGNVYQEHDLWDLAVIDPDDIDEG
jgi:hypothetical protein